LRGETGELRLELGRKANRQKPSSIAATESILKWHLVPELGAKRLDAITDEVVQRFKLSRAHLSPKTVNNILTLLSSVLKKAVWCEGNVTISLRRLKRSRRVLRFVPASFLAVPIRINAVCRDARAGGVAKTRGYV
jgi:hypothetical protein